MSDYGPAIEQVNQIQDDMARLARKVYEALEDEAIGFWEGVELGSLALDVGSKWLAKFESMNKDEISNLLYVLENMDIHLPPGV
jgi:hypothetical protein